MEKNESGGGEKEEDKAEPENGEVKENNTGLDMFGNIAKALLENVENNANNWSSIFEDSNTDKMKQQEKLYKDKNINIKELEENSLEIKEEDVSSSQEDVSPSQEDVSSSQKGGGSEDYTLTDGTVIIKSDYDYDTLNSYNTIKSHADKLMASLLIDKKNMNRKI